MKSYHWVASLMLIVAVSACNSSSSHIPSVVKTAFVQQFPSVTQVNWDFEDGVYEANWGGTSNENDSSARFTTAGKFVEEDINISSDKLPAAATLYVDSLYKDHKIKECSKNILANGTTTYETEIKDKHLFFDINGNFLKAEKK